MLDSKETFLNTDWRQRKSMGVDYINVVFIILNLAIPKIFYFKHGVEASWITIFLGNSGVNNIGDAMLVLFYGCVVIRLSHRRLFTYNRLIQASVGLATALKR